MSKAGKIRILLTILFGTFFLVVLLTFTLRPDSKRCEAKQIIKNWDISIPSESEVVYTKQTGFSLFGEGEYYTVVHLDFTLDYVQEEYKEIVDADLKTIKNWFDSFPVEIEESYIWSLKKDSVAKFLKKGNATAICLYNNEDNLLFILQSFQ